MMFFAMASGTSLAFAAPDKSDSGNYVNGKPFSDLQSQIDSIDTDFSSFQSQIDANTAQITSLSSQIDDLELQVTDIEFQITLLESDKDLLQNQITDNLSKIGILTNDLVSLQQQINILSNNLLSLIEDNSDDVDEIITKLSILNEKMILLQSEIDSNDADNQFLQSEIDSIDDAISALNDDIGNIQNSINSNSQKINGLNYENLSLTQRMSDVEVEIDGIDAILFDLIDVTITNIQNSISYLAGQVETNTADIAELKITTQKNSELIEDSDTFALQSRIDRLESAILKINQAPIVDACPSCDDDLLNLMVGETTQLTGIGMDADGLLDPITFLWESSDPNVVFSANDVQNPSVSADVVGDYEISLSVSDGLATVSDAFALHVFPPNTLPVVNAGNDIVVDGEFTEVRTGTNPGNFKFTYSLDCNVPLSAADPSVTDDGILFDSPSLLWNLGPKTPNSATSSLGSSTILYPTLISKYSVTVDNGPSRFETKYNMNPITNVLTLSADDGVGSSSDSVSITCNPENIAPTVFAGSDKSTKYTQWKNSDGQYVRECSFDVTNSSVRDEGTPSLFWSRNNVDVSTQGYANWNGERQDLNPTVTFTIKYPLGTVPGNVRMINDVILSATDDGGLVKTDTARFTCNIP